jgi:hypothetical protein
MSSTPVFTPSGAPSAGVVVLHDRVDEAFLAAYDMAIEAVSRVPLDVADLTRLSDATIAAATLKHAELRDAVGARGIVLSGQVANRSRPELGLQGMAQRAGFRSPEKMIQTVGRVTPREATTAVKLGTMVVEAADAGTVDPQTGEVSTPAEPWLRPVVDALRAGDLSPEGADAIRRGLGLPNSAVSIEQLLELARELCDAGIVLDPDTLFKRARSRRDELDAAGVAVREEELFQQRSLVHFPLPGGGGKAVWTMDTETYARFLLAYDRMTSPKRGGVSFVDEGRRERSDVILKDPRSPKQYASDGLIELIRLGEATDPDFMLGHGSSKLRITATKWDLDHADRGEPATGIARIEGVEEPVSIQTAERHECGDDVDEIIFDENLNPLDLQHRARFYSKKQNEVLATMFGGCAWGDGGGGQCDRPPSWTESHHVNFWKRDHGETNIKLGIPFCTFHHRVLHNNGWEIWIDEHADGDLRFWLIPPKKEDPEQTPIQLKPRSGSMRDLRAAMRKERASRRKNHAA